MTKIKKIKLSPRAGLACAFVIFMIVISTIVGVHSFVEGYGLHFSYSISRYIGLTYWSAGLFFGTSLLLFFLVYRFLKQTAKDWKMTRVWWLSSVFMVLMLVMLAACPVGLFDKTWGNFGIISILHQFSSRAMFLMAVLTGIETMVKFRKAKFIRFFAPFFVIYGAVFATLATVGNWFVMDNMLFFEWGFLIFYLVMMLGIPSFVKGNKQLDD